MKKLFLLLALPALLFVSAGKCDDAEPAADAGKATAPVDAGKTKAEEKKPEAKPDKPAETKKT